MYTILFSQELVLNIDFSPTFADLAGVEVPPDMDGQSLVPLLHHTKGASGNTWRTDFMVEHSGEAQERVSGCPQYTHQGVYVSKSKQQIVVFLVFFLLLLHSIFC